MDQAQVAAEEALEATVDACSDSGLVTAWRGLVQDVYSANLARYEPDELGDTAMALGIQCSENFKTRAVRRFRRDDLEPDEVHWNVDGLRVRTPRNVLTFDFGKVRVVTMKVPFAVGRSPRWDRIRDWEQDSQIRLSIAAENSRVLRYRTHAESGGLFPHTGDPGVVRNYMLLWAGEAEAALTAGWLGVPALGDMPFITRKLLWWDDEPHARITAKATPDRGPNFDQRPAVTPEVTLKRRPQEGQA